MTKGDLFWQRVAESIDWCAGRSSNEDPQLSLRSAVFGEPTLIAPWGFLQRGFDEWVDLPETEKNVLADRAEAHRTAIVDALCDRRSQLLKAARIRLSTGKKNLGEARFIIYQPEANLCDGAARTNSEGYYDNDNMPPWDTWIMYLQADTTLPGRLICWVPLEHIELVERGIEVNPERCIYWATEKDLLPLFVPS
jgi:hypothetical protein